MSLFNTVVKPHPLTKMMICGIRWALPHDTDGKYPLMGRLRYVWLSEDYQNVKLLLKDGPQSWTEDTDRDALMDQIKNHETFISCETYEKDPCYCIAEFKFIDTDKLDFIPAELRPGMDELRDNIEQIDKKLIDAGCEPMRKDPFQIFDEQLELMKNLPKGVALNEDVQKVADNLADVLKKITED